MFARSLFATVTRGSGMLHRAFQSYGHYKGPLDKVRKGVLISMAGQSCCYTCHNAWCQSVSKVCFAQILPFSSPCLYVDSTTSCSVIALGKQYCQAEAYHDDDSCIIPAAHLATHHISEAKKDNTWVSCMIFSPTYVCCTVSSTYSVNA